MRSSLLLLFLLITIVAATAQNGIIRGTVYEESSGEPLFGVAVRIPGTTNGAVTDFDGKFQINVEPGVHNLDASFISFKSVSITDLEVKEGEVTVIDAIWMQDAVEELEAIVVTAEVIKNSESALLTVKRKSANVMDGISAESFRKIGDANAGEAAKRVTGVSVEGGKYIYVRGLGDRYTKTTLNGVDIPGLDPDRNSIQIDIFPTNLIDNMVVYKSFSAELPADFTGGIVNIETKDFPESQVLDVSASLDFNPSMHFNGDYLTYEGSSTDFLGFDNGNRALPEEARGENVPTPINADNNDPAAISNFLGEFSPELGARQETSFMNYGLGVTNGNQYQLPNGHSIGYLATASYKNSTVLYDDAFFGEYQINSSDPNSNELVLAYTQDGTVARSNVLLAGMAGLAYKTSNSKFKFNFMRLQNGESTAAQFFLLDDPDDGLDAAGKSGFEGTADNLEYNERSVTNMFFNGEHHLADNTWTIDWRLSNTISTQDDPDIRRTPFTITRDIPAFEPGAAGNPGRLWRELDEINRVGKVDFTKEFGNETKLRFGFSQVYKERDYRILQYRIRFFGNQPDWSGDASEVWVEENLYDGTPGRSLYLSAQNSFPNPNEYNSTVSNTGVYASYEFNAGERFKSILGLRGENYVQRHTGRDQQVTIELDDEKVLDSFDFFPSANFIYSLQEKMNLRLGYSRTIARPSFKELSFAQIFDPLSNRIFNGGLFPLGEWDGDLTETRINNFDVRWEAFQDRGQLLSFSVFYKTFNDPIELVRIPEAQTNNEFQPRNVGDSELYGIEVEFRQSLELIAPALSLFSVTGNVTVVESVLTMSPTELRSRENNARTDQTIDNTRNMAGQAPWIVNAGVAYNNPVTGLDAGLFYNVKGKTLTVVGGGIFPDVYSQPFNSLNFNLNKGLGEERRAVITASISNILGDTREEFFEGFGGSEAIFQRWSPGTSFGVGLKYSF